MAKLYTSPPKFSELPVYIRDDVPVYRLRDDIFTDDTLFPKGSTIEADKDYIPSLVMFPVNEAALEIYRSMLKDLDNKGKAYDEMSLEERRGYMQWIPKLPAFEKEWEKVNGLAKSRRIHICHAVDQAPSILGAPRTSAPKVRSVDMSAVPQLTRDEQPVVQGNKAKVGRPRKGESVLAVQSAVDE